MKLEELKAEAEKYGYTLSKNKLNEKVKNIIDCINNETERLEGNDRAMVLLLVMELIKCAVELDILCTLRPNKRKENSE